MDRQLKIVLLFWPNGCKLVSKDNDRPKAEMPNYQSQKIMLTIF